MIYKRQDFCYRLVQFRRHRLSHIHVCIQHSGKWFVFYDFYLMLPGDLFDLRCQIILTFCNHNRGIRHLRIVFDRYSIMGGVRDDHIRLGQILHHSAGYGP